MKTTCRFDQFRTALHAEMPSLRQEYGVQSLALFGSHVRGDATPGSDLDVLVDFLRPIGLLKFMELEQHLTDCLGVRVDLVMSDALKPNMGRRILQEAVSV